ncbi:riboflavin-specific deaminase, partial [Pseudomonas sp. MAFF212428]|nr:riboflavin-specific deaminase [Pseudomonas brassicae]
RGVTAYVTLEPCAFHGRTPSCAQALIDAGVGACLCWHARPGPRNAGAGVRMLRQAGVEVIVGLLADDVSRDLRTYLMAEA